MRSPASEVIEEGAALGHALLLLDDGKAAGLRALLAKRYGLNERDYHWHRLANQDHASVHDPESWRWLDEFCGRAEFVMFFDEDRDRGIVLFGQGVSVVEVLGECTGFVFYLSDLQASYVLCFNDHDVLIAAGESEEWLTWKVESKRDAPEPDGAL